MSVSKSPMEALIAAAKENEKREKEKSLQDNVNASSVKASQTSKKKEESASSSDAPRAHESNSSDEAISAAFSKYLVKGAKEASVVVQIPARIHQEIKLISFLSGAPINSIVANILEDALSKNEKEIAKLKKKIK